MRYAFLETKTCICFKDAVVIPVLMFACNRVTVAKAVDSLLSYRTDPAKFPIIVSQVRTLINIYNDDLFSGYFCCYKLHHELTASTYQIKVMFPVTQSCELPSV